MSDWTAEELQAVGSTDQIQVSSVRRDGSTTKPVTIWIVEAGDRVYVRSAHGPKTGWYLATSATGQGHLSIGSVEKDVAFAPVTDEGELQAVDQAYLTKYDRFRQIAEGIVTPDARVLTVRATPR